MPLRVIGGGAVSGLVARLRPEIAQATGETIEGTYGAVGAMRALIEAEGCDVAMLSAKLMQALVASGHVVAGSLVDLGSVDTAVAVKAGDPVPAVATAADLVSAFRQACAIYIPDPVHATAGQHVALVLDRLGLREAVAGRLRTFPNGMTAMAALARHEGGRAIGSTQVTEIVATEGVRLVASLPAPFDLTTVYTAGVDARSVRPDLARLMIEVLSAPERAADRIAVGFTG